MQAQQISPYSEGTAEGTERQGYGGLNEHASLPEGAEDHTHNKKSILGKVKDKAKKLKTKIKKPKSSGVEGENKGTSSESSSDEEDSGGQLGDQLGEEEREAGASDPKLKGVSHETILDTDAHAVPSGANIVDRFGDLNLGEKPDTRKLQGETPSAAGQASAGVAPYLQTHDFHENPFATRASTVDIPVEEGENGLGQDLLVTPTAGSDHLNATPMESSDVPIVTDGASALSAPMSAENLAKTRMGQQEEESKEPDQPVGTKKSILEQAKEKIFGSSKQLEAAPQPSPESAAHQSKPITSRAVETVSGLKDNLASKFGYGSSKSFTTPERAPQDGEAEAATIEPDMTKVENKSIVQQLQETAAGATSVITSKLGDGGDKQQALKSSEEATGLTADKKSYTQKAYDVAQSAKDSVVSKLGYGKTESTPSREGADSVVSKLGYGKTESTASREENSIAKETTLTDISPRFHPGEEDRALSQLITEKMSTGAATVKDTLLRPFTSKSSSPSPTTTTPSPSPSAGVVADLAHSRVCDETVNCNMPEHGAAREQKLGIVGKMTGAVSSLLGTSAPGKKRADEAVGQKEEEDCPSADVH